MSVATKILLHFGSGCSRALNSRGKTRLWNDNIQPYKVPIERNVIGVLNEYSYPAPHGLFCDPSKRYNFVARGLIERLNDASEESPLAEYFDFMFHQSAVRNVSQVYPSMPVRFDIIQLTNAIRQGEGDEEIEDCVFAEQDNPLLSMSSIGQLPDGVEEGALEERVSFSCKIIESNTIILDIFNGLECATSVKRRLQW